MPKELNAEQAAVRRQSAAENTPDAGPAPHPLLALQRQVGNAQIARMLAQRAAPEEEDEALQLSRDESVQRQEVEEEDEALQLSRDEAVQRQEVEEKELQLSRDEAVQRQEVEEEELQLSRDQAVQRASAEEEDEALQLSRGPEVGPEGGPVSDATASRIESLRGSGSGLDQGARAEMEGSLGDSFADVRVHTGAESHQLNRSLGAKAFTTGSDIFFAEGASPTDKGLLAHELTHVTQQRAMSGGGPLTVGPADDAYEAQAEASASAVSSAAPPAAQRKPDEAP